MTVDKKKLVGQSLVILAGCFWGCIGICSRKLSAYGASSFQIGLIRGLIATVVLFVIIAIKDIKLLKIKWKDIWIFICMGVIGFSLLSVCYMTSISENSLSVACILMYTAPIWVMLVSTFLFKEKLTLLKGISIGACFVGCVFICSSSSIKMTWFGFLMGIGSGVTYASYSIFGKIASKEYSPLTATFYAFLFATLSLLPVAGVEGLAKIFAKEPTAIWFGVGIGVANTVIPFLIYTVGLSLMDASKAAVFAIIDPVVAAIIGVIAFGEAFGGLSFLGMIVIFFGLFLQSNGEELFVKQRISFYKREGKLVKKIKLNYKRESKQNPYIGFTSFQHFRNDELYSDLIVRPENNMTETEHVECYPVPDYVEEKGRAQGYYPDCSIAYIRILWKEFEPKKGEYNYAFIESILQKAKENEQTVMFRLMPHSTRESDDVPDWVKEEMECPSRPQGERVKVSPRDPKFLELFGNAIKKIAEKFDSDSTLAFVDVSLPGAWGEGSSVELFTEEQIKKFADIYTEHFKQTVLIGQVIPWIVHQMNEKAQVGWRADCIGRPNLTFEYVPSLQCQMPDIWKKGHISFEAYWWLGEWKRQGWDLDKIIDATLSWHISTFNAKSLPIPFEWKDTIDEWISKMGYHFTIDSVELTENVRAGAGFSFTLTIDNVGVAPIYHYLPLRVKLKNETYEKVFATDVDIRTWSVGKKVETINVSLPNDMGKGAYLLEVGIGGEGDPWVAFATDAELDGQWYILTKINIA